jgi:hypothetical protein
MVFASILSIEPPLIPSAPVKSGVRPRFDWDAVMPEGAFDALHRTPNFVGDYVRTFSFLIVLLE